MNKLFNIKGKMNKEQDLAALFSITEAIEDEEDEEESNEEPNANPKSNHSENDNEKASEETKAESETPIDKIKKIAENKIEVDILERVEIVSGEIAGESKDEIASESDELDLDGLDIDWHYHKPSTK